jgi:hypothetical protein
MNPVMATALYGRGLTKQRSGDTAGALEDMNAAQSIQADVAGQFAKWGVTGRP